jgi:hypothetical protein
MPRINIEEKWWSDPRRMTLTAKLGMGTADGCFFILARLAQEHNGEPFDATGMVPDEWIQAILSCGLAIGQPNAIYIKGSREHHNWIKSQRERASLGGRKSNKLREATAKQTQANAQPSSSSSSSSLTTTSEIEKFEESFEPASPEISEAVVSIYKQFNQAVPKDVRRSLARIKNHFENRESFANWSNEIFALDKGARQYTVALLKEIGVFS